MLIFAVEISLRISPFPKISAIRGALVSKSTELSTANRSTNPRVSKFCHLSTNQMKVENRLNKVFAYENIINNKNGLFHVLFYNLSDVDLKCAPDLNKYIQTVSNV